MAEITQHDIDQAYLLREHIEDTGVYGPIDAVDPHDGSVQAKIQAILARALADARCAPPGCVIDDKGVVRREVYLVYSREHNAWWGPNRAGYFVDIGSAGRYSNEEADDIVRNSGPRGGYAGEGCHEFKMLAPESLAAAEAVKGNKP